jgi:hypothetical protein
MTYTAWFEEIAPKDGGYRDDKNDQNENASLVRRDRRPAVRRSVPDRRRHPRQLRPATSSGQLAFGDSGWTQRTNFLITGLLTLAFAVGLRRALRTLGGSTWGPLLVGAYAIGLLGAGIFVADPMSGYPPGTPDKRLIYSVHGVLHDLFSTLVFLGLPVACFVFGRWFAARGERGWAIYSAVTAVVFLGAFILSSAGFGQAEGLVDLAGLFQRVTLIAGFGWLTLLAFRFLRSLRER